MFCPKCGTNVPEGSKFCEQCGNNMQQSIKENPAQPEPLSEEAATAQAVEPVAAPPAPEAPPKPAPQPVYQPQAAAYQPQPQASTYQPQYNPPQPPIQPLVQPAPVSQINPGMDPREKVYSVWGWLGTMLLLCIPIVNIIMPFVWAFGSKANKNKKNWAIASLIMFVLFTIFSIVLSTVIISYINLFLNQLGGFDFGDLGSGFYFE